MNRPYARSLVLGLVVVLRCFCPAPLPAQIVAWTGAGTTTSWATGANWSNSTGPNASQVALFGAGGQIPSPLVATNVLDANRTIAGLAYQPTTGNFHVTDLNGFTLSVTGDLSSEYDSVNSGAAIVKNGALDVGQVDSLGSVSVGRRTLGGGQYFGTLDLSAVQTFAGHLDKMWIGVAEAGMVGGSLSLAQANTFNVNSLRVGYSAIDTNVGAISTVTLGQSNTIFAEDVLIGGRLSNGTVTMAPGATLALGSAVARTNLAIGQEDVQTNFANSGSLKLAGGTFNAYLDNLTVGEMTGSTAGGTSGTLLGGASGAIDVGAPGNTAGFYVGHSINGSQAIGVVDFSGQDSLTAKVDVLGVGVAEGGTAQGTLKLAETNAIDANAIRVGHSSQNVNTGFTSVLTLGQTNTLTANEFTVGGNLSNGTVSLPAGGTLHLGAADAPTALTVGQNIVSTNFANNAALNLAGGTFNAHLSSLVVGDKGAAGGGGASTGVLNAGSNGSISIGTQANSRQSRHRP